MFFLRANKESIKSLKQILSQYENASGQSINAAKSSITFSRRAPADLRQRIKDELNMQKEGGVGKYLGLPEHFGRRKRDLFTSIVDKIRQKRNSWSNRFLSAAGKMTMLQSVLSPIPSHAMTCFKLPVSLCKRIQSEVTSFWWGDNTGKRKIAWTSWEKMSKPKEIGGLGFRDFQAFNDAYLGKLSWRIMNNPDILLTRVLMGKYCVEESFMECSKKTSSSYGWQGVLIGRDLLSSNMGWVVGNGTSIKIWYSPWLSLSEQEGPIGPAREEDMNLTVSDLFQQGSNEWDDNKIQNMLPHLKEKIVAIKPSLSGAPDKRVWLGTKTGEYTNKTGYKAAIKIRGQENILIADQHEMDWYKSVWNLNVSPKVKLFLWKVFQNAIPVGELLAIRNVNVDIRCKHCNAPESINHLFLHCPFAKKVWEHIPVTPTVDLSGFIDLSEVWARLCSKACLPPTGLATGPLAPWILWQIWISRNSLCFNNKQISEEETINRAIRMAKEWTNAQEHLVKSQKKIPSCTPIPLNCSLMRSDAAWRVASQLAGLGWTIRREGEEVASFSSDSSVNSALVAEAMAMRQAVKESWILGHKRMRCEADSDQLIKALNGNEVPLEIYGIVADILDYSFRFEAIEFVWISREKNSVADGLAKQGLVMVESLMANT